MSDSCTLSNPLPNSALEAKVQQFTSDFFRPFDGQTPWANANFEDKLVAQKFIEDTLKLPAPDQHAVFARAQQLNDSAQCALTGENILPVLNIVFDQQGKLAEFRDLTVEGYEHFIELDLYHP